MPRFVKNDRVVCIADRKAKGKTAIVLEDSKAAYWEDEWTRVRWEDTGTISAIQCKDFERCSKKV